MNIEEYKYLWDGRQPDWTLHHIDRVVWYIIFEFGKNGPSKENLLKIRRIIPEFQDKSVPEIYKMLKSKDSYRTINSYGNIEAKWIEEKAIKLGLKIKREHHQTGGYLPVSKDNEALIIENNDIAKEVAKKMVDAGVKVIQIHVD